MAPVSRSYGGETAAQRSDRRRAMMLEAALDLIAEGGASAVSKRAVCARARLNDRYFYEHFADRDVLLNTLAEELTAEGLREVVGATLRSRSGLREQTRAGIDAALEFLTADPRRGRLLLQAYTTEVVQRARLASTRTIASAMVSIVENQLDDVSRTDVDMAAFAAVCGVMELVAAWLRNEIDTSREHLAEVITDLLISNLRISWIGVDV